MICAICRLETVVCMVMQDGRRICRRCVFWPVEVVAEPAAWPKPGATK